MHTRYFCEICKEECDNHNRPLGCLSTKGYKNLERKFLSRTRKKLTKKQFKNKWDLLKKEYTQFMELKNAATGLGWNDELGTIEADNDWWKTHLEVCSNIQVVVFRMSVLLLTVMLYFRNIQNMQSTRTRGLPT